MEIAIIDAEGYYGVYFDGEIKSHKTDLNVSEILHSIMEHAEEMGILPTVDSFEQFYLEEDEQFEIIENADGVFPDTLDEAKRIYGL